MRLMNKCNVRHIKQYLENTSTYMDLPDGNQRLSTCSVDYKTDKEKGVKFYVDSDFANV